MSSTTCLYFGALPSAPDGFNCQTAAPVSDVILFAAIVCVFLLSFIAFVLVWKR